MSIRFDSQGCITALRRSLIEAMKDLQKELLAESKQGMKTPEGKDDLQDGDITDIANVITASITGGAWAIMNEFGTGSEMDLFNPALQDYMASKAWNPARENDTTIRSRPDRPGQVDIFGNPVNGHGDGGVDLEELGVFDAQPPSHAIETAMRWMKHGRLQSKIKATVQAFPFHRYIITNNK